MPPLVTDFLNNSGIGALPEWLILIILVVVFIVVVKFVGGLFRFITSLLFFAGVIYLIFVVF